MLSKNCLEKSKACETTPWTWALSRDYSIFATAS